MDFTQARINMVDSQIHTAGITSEEILKSFQTIPREFFVPANIETIAYSDGELSVGAERYLLEPIVHAKIIQAVEPSKNDVVLDIGITTGYSSAILSPLVTTIVALENDKKYLNKANSLWKKLDACNIVGIEGNLPGGAPDHAPFSLIILNGAVEKIPATIVDQLTPDGRLIAVVKEQGAIMGKVTLVQRNNNGHFSTVELFDAGAHYLPGFKTAKDFNF